MEPVKEIEFDRTYDAPVAAVWDAWTKPERVKQWWGPDNVTIVDCEIDLRVGGRIYIVMKAGAAMGPAEGLLWPMDGTLTVVDDQSKLNYSVIAWTEGQRETTQIKQSQELAISIENGKTKLHVKATIHSTGIDGGMAIDGMQYGYNQQLEKLAGFLESHDG